MSESAQIGERAEEKMPYQTREEMLQHTINRLSHRIEERDQRIATLEAEKATEFTKGMEAGRALSDETTEFLENQVESLQTQADQLEAENRELRAAGEKTITRVLEIIEEAKCYGFNLDPCTFLTIKQDYARKIRKEFRKS